MLVIHTPAECTIAFAEAAQHNTPLLFTLPKGAVRYMGLRYIYSMIEKAANRNPTVHYRFICDCDDDAQLVQEAFRIGFQTVSFSGNKETADKLKQIADHYDAELLSPDIS